MNEWDERAPTEVEDVHRLLEYLYPDFDRNSPAYPNIEDFFNQLEMAKRFNSENFFRSKLWTVDKLSRISALTLKALSGLIHLRMAEHEHEVDSPLQQFVNDMLVDGDTVISFNWDTTFEAAVSRSKQFRALGGNYSRSWGGGLVLLKPHGSVNWYSKTSAFGKPEISFGSYLEDLPPLIVPPVADKQFLLPLLKRIWISVYKSVSDATELYILGYSLPREDQFTRFVLRRAVRNNLRNVRDGKKKDLKATVVNPNSEVKKTFQLLFGSRFRFRKQTFARYVLGHG